LLSKQGEGLKRSFINPNGLGGKKRERREIGHPTNLEGRRHGKTQTRLKHHEPNINSLNQIVFVKGEGRKQEKLYITGFPKGGKTKRKGPGGEDGK